MARRSAWSCSASSRATDIDPAAFALAGMAGVVAGATGAALTAIVMIFEMTLDYGLVLPMTVTVAVAYGLRRSILADSIYSMKLSRRGHYIPSALQANPHLVHHVADLHLLPALRVPADATPDRLPGDGTNAHVVVLDGARVVAALSPQWVLGHAEALRCAPSLGAVEGEAFVTVQSDSTLFNLLSRMQVCRAPLAVVLAPGPTHEVLGVVTMGHLAEILAEGMEMFGD